MNRRQDRGVMTDNSMPKAYDHRIVGEPLYDWWEQHGYSRRRSKPR